VTRLPSIVHPEAQQEIAAFAMHYEAAAPGLGRRLLLELDATLTRIAVFPEAYQKIFGEFRRAPIHRFPFAVAYRMSDTAILVDAVFPTRSNPVAIGDVLADRTD